MNHQKGFINILVAVVVLAAIGAVGYYVVLQRGSQPYIATTETSQDYMELATVSLDEQQKLSEQSASPAETKQIIAPTYIGSLKTYKNARFGFEVKYPSNLKVEEGKIEPNTHFVVWKNPNFANAKVNIIYINDGKSTLTSAELTKGTTAKIGSKSGYKFVLNNNPLFWVDAGSYALAIYFEKPQGSGSNYNEYIDISSFKF